MKWKTALNTNREPNKMMNDHTKKALKSGIVAGITFALVTAGFEYFAGQDFRIWKFMVNILFFGILMGLFFRYSLKKQNKK